VLIEIVRDVAARRGLPSAALVGAGQTPAVVAARVECFRRLLDYDPNITRDALCELFGFQPNTVRLYRRRSARERSFDAHPSEVIAAVAERLHVPVADIMGRGRTLRLVAARHAAMREVARLCPSMGVIDIAKVFRRDHSTISHALGHLKPRKRKSPAV
jgi:hypothetical protein